MTYRSGRIALFGALGLGLALGMQACGNGSSDAAVQTPAGAPSSASPTSSASAPSSASPTSSGQGASTHQEGGPLLKPCTDADVKVTVTYQPQFETGKDRLGLVAVTNKSDKECTVDGRVSVSLTNAANEVVKVPTANVNEPGDGVRIALKSGSSAFEGIKWTLCDKGDETCGVGNGMRASLTSSTGGPAAALSGFPAPEKSDITMKTLKIGTVQPIADGVVAW